MNNPENFNEFNNHLKLNNILQIELVSRLEPEITDEAIAKWVGLYSAKFRELVSQKLEINPNFWSDLENPETKEAILNELENELYHEEDFKKAA